MPIDTKNPSYIGDQWAQMRDCFAGDSAIKARRDLYLTRAAGQSKDEYDKMLKRAFFLPVLSRTISEVTGNIMRKPITVELPERLKPMIYDVGNGKDLNTFTAGLIDELLLTSRRGILVDFDDAKKRPVFRAYSAESIINWSADFIILREPFLASDPDDKYNLIEAVEYRELTRDDDGFYMQRVWKADGDTYVAGEPIYPTKLGDKLTEIPFVFVNPIDNTPAIKKPVFKDLSDANLQHYQVYSDLRQVIQATTHKPTFLFMDGKPPTTIKYGIGGLNHIPDSAGHAEVVSDQGGISEYLSVLDKLEHQMAALGARALQAKRAQVQTAESARVEQSGDSATLMTIADSVESALIKAFELAAGFLGVDESQIDIKVNKDFIEGELDAAMIGALLQAINTGRMSQRTFTEYLQRGEIVSIDIDEELGLIADGQ